MNEKLTKICQRINELIKDNPIKDPESIFIGYSQCLYDQDILNGKEVLRIVAEYVTNENGLFDR